MKTIRLITALVVLCAGAANAFIYGNDNVLRWNGGSSTWDDANNWDNVQGGDLGAPGGNTAYAIIDDGTATIASGNVPAGDVYRTYIGGTGVGGQLDVSADSGYGRFYTAWESDETGRVNLTAGTMSMNSGNLVFGNAGASVVTIAGGTMNASDMQLASAATATSDFTLSSGAVNASGDMILAYYAGSTSELTVSGGTLDVNRLWMRSGDATLNVMGSGSTITADRFLVGATGHDMVVGLDAEGVTEMNINGTTDGYNSATLSDLAIMVTDLAGFNGTVGSTYDLIRSTETIEESGLTVSGDAGGVNGITGFTWAIVTDGSDEVLRLTAVPEPATMGLFGIVGAIMFWIRRRVMI